MEKPWVVALLSVLLLGAATDPWGNVYPPLCADLSDVKPSTHLRIVDVRHLPLSPGAESRCGVWLERPEGHVIFLLKGCPEPRAEVLRHELCHEKMWRETGDPRWHD